MRFVTLCSGSSGNATLVSHQNTHILIDAGLSFRALKTSLAKLGLEPRDLTALFLTHEHSDHVRGVPAIAEKTAVPIYGRRASLEAVVLASGTIMPDRLTALAGDGNFEAGELYVHPFETPHDSAACVGYSIFSPDGRKLSLVTDLGCVTETVAKNLHNSDFVLIESNYDEQMLRTGRYPPYLKRRIASDSGHLSNAACAEVVESLVCGGTEHFVLVHLSDKNNLPKLALETTCRRLMSRGVRPGEVTVDIAPRFEMSRPFDF
ncbi:MBL fold metallo-hydrolase [Feifania hominis]|uniref:MBL fold metallo-hydrolase n=1 Tax=Feifania hominis TaxID=2763660 RepID=A0A926DGL2_9FIRM|nr:MBL fold metallo-hydrolase [Feifania hominis]MBC8536924.1 MBL fold metallo-hydrolase [Feifania hominis]